MVCLIAWIECSCIHNLICYADNTKCHDLFPASSPDMFCMKVNARHNSCITMPKHACRFVSDVQALQIVIPLSSTSQKPTKLFYLYLKPQKYMYKPLPAAHTQIDGLPDMAPTEIQITQHPGQSIGGCTCFWPADLCESCAVQANDVKLQQRCLALPVLSQTHTTAKMAQGNDRDKDRAPRSRWRADGTRRRTKGERMARAPFAKYWKERQRKERESEREPNEPAPSTASHHAEWWCDRGYDEDNNRWTYEWACNQERGAAREGGDNSWWNWSDRNRDEAQQEPDAPETPPPAPKAQKRQNPESPTEGEVSCPDEDSDMETVEVTSEEEDVQPMDDEAGNRVAEAPAPSSSEQLHDMPAEDEYAMYHGRVKRLMHHRQEEVSKALTNLLRRSAEKAGLTVATNGFVSATALLKTRRFQRDRISMAEIVAAVAFAMIKPDLNLQPATSRKAHLGRASSSERFRDIRFAQWTMQLP